MSSKWRACLLTSVVIGSFSLTATGQAETHLSYEAYAAGLNVLNIDAALDVTQINYHVQVTTKTAGFFGLIVHGDLETTVAGLKTAAGVAPARTYAYGTFRGEPRRTQIDYVAGQPRIVILEPALDQERDPVPPEMQRDTIDTESAVVQLIYHVAATGRCESSARIFDGRRLSEVQAVTAGVENLAPEKGSAFSGPALRCNFEGRQLAGFVHDVDEATLKRVQHGSAWLAPLRPGAMPFPVKMQFNTRFFGDATMYLTKHD